MKWYNRHREEINLKRRKSDKTKSPKGISLRFKILARDNFTCQYCGRNVKDDGVKLQVDHILPKSIFPQLAKDKSNLITSCRECNLGKSNLMLHI